MVIPPIKGKGLVADVGFSVMYKQGCFLARALPHEEILTGNLVWTWGRWQLTGHGSLKYQNEEALFCSAKCHRTSLNVPYSL